MNTIPLVKGNTQEEINTSLIALKKALDEMNSSSSKTDASVQSQIKQINELIDTINEQITDLQPVDSVTSGNMQSVTSNAVAVSLLNKCTTQNINNSQTNGVLRNRVNEGIVTINAYDTTGTGLSIDFNFKGSTITVFRVVNGNTVEQKSVTLS